jgi:hypothetical protein
MIFWGLWLIPFGILVYRSRFLPRFLGVWLIVNGLAYLANSFTDLLLPHYANAVGNFTLPALTGEVAFVPWLLIRGQRSRPLMARHRDVTIQSVDRRPCRDIEITLRFKRSDRGIQAPMGPA